MSKRETIVSIRATADEYEILTTARRMIVRSHGPLKLRTTMGRVAGSELIGYYVSGHMVFVETDSCEITISTLFIHHFTVTDISCS